MTATPNTPFFEGMNPTDRKSMTFVSNSIDTSPIDAYRQGIELSLPKYYQQGIVKIHSNKPDHALDMDEFGQRDDQIFPDQLYYDDIAKFVPSLYLSDYYYHQTIVIDTHVIVNEVGFDGIIEPFPIRRVITFTSIDIPFEARSVKADLESANWDPYRSSDLLVDRLRFSERSLGTLWYEDNVDMAGRTPANLGFWPTVSTRRLAFDDAQVRDGVILPVACSADFREALKVMRPPTENYLPKDYYASTATLHDQLDYYAPAYGNT